MRDQRTRQHPDLPLFRQQLAGTLTNLALVLQDGGNTKEAEDVYRRSIAYQEELLTAQPARVTYRSELAQSYTNLAALLQRTGQSEGAEIALRRSCELLGSLSDSGPEVLIFKRGWLQYRKTRVLAGEWRHAIRIPRKWPVVANLRGKAAWRLGEASLILRPQRGIMTHRSER